MRAVFSAKARGRHRHTHSQERQDSDQKDGSQTAVEVESRFANRRGHRRESRRSRNQRDHRGGSSPFCDEAPAVYSPDRQKKSPLPSRPLQKREPPFLYP